MVEFLRAHSEAGVKSGGYKIQGPRQRSSGATAGSLTRASGGVLQRKMRKRRRKLRLSLEHQSSVAGW